MATPTDFYRDLEYAKSRLGITFDLKEKQLQTLRSLYEGKDTLAVLPTGYGKSVIFQLLPFLMQRKLVSVIPMIVLIVTPLNSIMQDQVQNLAESGIPACFLNIEGTGARTYKMDIFRETEESDQDNDIIFSSVPIPDIKQGKYCLVYAHPETLVENRNIGEILRSDIYKDRVCCTVIDEVHMISEWGKDFRKSFHKLGQLTCIYPDVPHLALTATATKLDMQKLCSILEFRNPTYIVQNPDRPNIYFEVRERLPNIKKYEKYDKILEDLCSELKEQMSDFPVTIVYCDNLEAIGYSYMFADQELGSRAFIPASSQVPENRIFAQYHKSYSEKMKQHIVSELTKVDPKIRLVFASVALGMGLNAPAVSRIIHFRPPTTLEKYLQEVGRAGRSGQNATAILYYNNSDIASNRKGLDPTVKAFVKNTETCLRKNLMDYFGFDMVLYNGPLEHCCSNCRNSSS